MPLTLPAPAVPILADSWSGSPVFLPGVDVTIDGRAYVVRQSCSDDAQSLARPALIGDGQGLAPFGDRVGNIGAISAATECSVNRACRVLGGK